MDRQVKYLLPESELPRHWYNVLADLPASTRTALSHLADYFTTPVDQSPA